jgi:hypothetical protein
MPAYKESERTKTSGIYTGCPCPIKLKTNINGKPPQANKKLNDLIFEWTASCEKFRPGPFVPISCYYARKNYCKFSLKEEEEK